jgi:hypothetical protein
MAATKYLAHYIKQAFPQVTRFSVDFWSPASRSFAINGFHFTPPVVKWSVEDKSFSYMLSPKVNYEALRQMVALRDTVGGSAEFHERHVVSYEGQELAVFAAVEASIKGQEAIDAVNEDFSSTTIPGELYDLSAAPDTQFSSSFPLEEGWPGLKV